MAKRVDTFRADGSRQHAVYTNSTADHMFAVMREQLVTGRYRRAAEWMNVSPIVSVMIGPDFKESPRGCSDV